VAWTSESNHSALNNQKGPAVPGLFNGCKSFNGVSQPANSTASSRHRQATDKVRSSPGNGHAATAAPYLKRADIVAKSFWATNELSQDR
jgi:hypothetical protein